MSSAQPSGSKLRSVGALLAGMIAIVTLSLATDSILHRAGVLPPAGEAPADSALLLATAYRTAYGIIGSFIASRLAPARPMAHAVALGAVGVFSVTVGMAVTWNQGPEFGAHWYPIALIVLALPAGWAGGKLSSQLAA